MIRPDFIFSYWIFFWFLFYYICHKISYTSYKNKSIDFVLKYGNPKFALYCGLIWSLLLFVYLFVAKANAFIIEIGRAHV